MNAICNKDIKEFKNGEQYHICPVLSGYQVTVCADENEFAEMCCVTI